MHMQRLTICALLFFLMVSCGKKTKDINADEAIETIDFIESFPQRELPIMFQQKDLKKTTSDSFFIKNTVVSTFLPDSIFKAAFPRTKDVRFYSDANNAFKAAMPLVEKNSNPGVSTEGGIDKRLTVIKTRNTQSKDGKAYYNKSAYVYNTEGLFTLILTESNEPVEEKTVYNPIDTLSRKDPLSGDYKQDKKNFVSIRDGGKAGKLLFFINIEKPGNGCDGSLRGDITQVKPKVYHYNKADDHCILEFSFNGKTLQVRELEACGNHRGVRCSFDGKFRK